MAEAWTFDRFRRAAQAHIHAARALVSPAAGGPPPPQLLPQSAVYLAQVALECALKARILSRGGFSSAADLQKKLPKVHDALFKSKKGHEIEELAKQLRLAKLLQTEGASLREDDCWKRLCSAERAYRLRYGAESMTSKDATDDVERVASLVPELVRSQKMRTS